MLKRLITVAVLLLAGARAEAQTCTLNGGTPYTSATPLSTISTAINAAADGAVACLRRGNTWSTSGILISGTHSNANRVTICSSNSTQCDPCPTLSADWWSSSAPTVSCVTAAGANAKLSLTGAGPALNFAGGTSGFNIKDIDTTGTGASCGTNADNSAAYYMPLASNITIEGGKTSGIEHLTFNATGAEGSQPTNIKFGTCFRPLELTGCGTANEPRWAQYGLLDNSYFSLSIHHYGPTDGAQNQPHIMDYTADSLGADGRSADNIVEECNRWEIDQGNHGWGNLHRVQNAENLTIRDSRFYTPGLSSSSSMGFLDTSNHGCTNCATYADVNGLTIDRVYVSLGVQLMIENKAGRNVTIQNSIFEMLNITPNLFPSYAFSLLPRQNALFPSNNVKIRNNVIAYYGPEAGDGPFIKLCTDGCAGVTDNQFTNNLVIDSRTMVGHGEFAGRVTIGCSAFGTNGANIKNNWGLFGDSTPQLTDCSGASPSGSANGFSPDTPWTTAPGIADTTPDGSATDYVITSGSAIYGLGDAASASTADFTGATRPSPPSIGPYDVPSPPSSDSVTVDSPNGGEVLVRGSGFNISWGSTGAWLNAHIEYATNGCAGTFSDVVASTPNDGQYAWTVPNVESDTVCIRISDAANAATTDKSNAVFSIIGILTVTFPNGGEQLTVGASFTVTWTSAQFLGANVAIEFSCNDGVTWPTVLSASTSNDGSFASTVPDCPTSQGRIRVRDPDGAPTDNSDASFYVNKMTVTFPNGSESFNELFSLTITWAFANAPGVTLVDIDYSVDNCDGPWTQIVSGTTNDGSYVWQVVAVAADEADACIRVEEADGDPTDTSDAVFTIKNVAAPTFPGTPVGTPILIQ